MRLSLTFLFAFISTAIVGQKISKQLEYEDLKLIDGTTISSADLENKVIVVNLWGTWCKPCVQELPDLNELYAKYKNDHRIVFLAIAEPKIDSPEKIKKFLETRSFDFKHIVPATQSIFFNLIGTVKYPTTVVYNSEGKLVKKFVDTLTENDIRKITGKLDELIEEIGS